MRHYLILLRHELRVLIITPSTYIAAVLFLGVMGFFFQELLATYAAEPSDVSPAVGFFKLFFFPVFFLTPLLTMRSLAEERRLGTIETLMTTPVTSIEVVLAKFSASYIYYLALWLSTLSFHYVLYRFAANPQVIDPGPLLGGYLFVALSGLMFIATGIFSSAMTRSQLVAGLLTFALTIVLTLGLRKLADLALFMSTPGDMVNAVAAHVQIFQHADDFVSGVFDSRAPVFYVSTAAFMLFLSVLALDGRSARS